MSAVYTNGAATISSSASVLCVVPSNSGVLVQNAGSNDVYLGGSTVTSSGATQGVKLATGVSQLIPGSGVGPRSLYAISPTGTTVAFLFAD